MYFILSWRQSFHSCLVCCSPLALRILISVESALISLDEEKNAHTLSAQHDKVFDPFRIWLLLDKEVLLRFAEEAHTTTNEYTPCRTFVAEIPCRLVLKNPYHTAQSIRIGTKTASANQNAQREMLLLWYPELIKYLCCIPGHLYIYPGININNTQPIRMHGERWTLPLQCPESKWY